MPADPTHHHAERPWVYPMPVAPTVDPAPRLAASSVEKSSAGDSRRPATKKSSARRTDRDVHQPISMRKMEYTRRAVT